MDTGLTLVDLSSFTGKETIYYERFVTEALSQAGDLFELASGLTELPDGGLDSRVAKRGVLAMAEALYEGQNSRDLRFSPFRTETIGSYSYSLATNAIVRGVPTGIDWFDLAVTQLRGNAVSNSSVHAFDRPGDYAEGVDGEKILVGPADTNNFRGSPHIGRATYVDHPANIDNVDDWPFS